MTTPAPDGYKVIATVKSVKGVCKAGHKTGDSFEVSCRNTAGMCGFFYHDIFSTIQMLQMGGTYPSGRESIEVGCLDRRNEVTIELKRLK